LCSDIMGNDYQRETLTEGSYFLYNVFCDMTGCIELIEIDVSRLKNNSGEIKKLNIAVDMPPVLSEVEKIEFDGPVKLDLVLTNVNNTIVVEGDISAKLRLACGNCLDSFTFPVQAEFSETYYNEGREGIEPGEFYTPYNGDKLDLTPEVIKSIFVALPMRVVCRQDCKGLCPTCGRNRNRENCDCAPETIDPRLEMLKKLLPKD